MQGKLMKARFVITVLSQKFFLKTLDFLNIILELKKPLII